MKFDDLKNNLSRQLLSIVIVMCGITFISLVLLLPQLLVPVYEKNIYQYLKAPLELVDDTVNVIKTDVAYLYITADSRVIESDNLKSIIPLNARQIIDKVKLEYGKFTNSGKTYYYNTAYNNHIAKISITDDKYISEMKTDILSAVFPVMLITFILISTLILWWSRKLVKKIENLKVKIDNIDNETYIEKFEYKADDELTLLSRAIDDMKTSLKEQEEYKNQMYQNISHDFKTPLSVIKSYIEAIDDGVENEKKGLEVIKNQVDKLEIKVHSLLYLNKLNYIKDIKNYKEEKIDVSDILKTSIEKFKIQNPNIKFEIHIEDKKTVFNGTYDMWEAILDNILNNFMRYAETIIKITIKNNRIILFNDGANIDETILNDIFSPYKKGIKGQFGLGLSIVKKTLFLFGYEVSVKNEKQGVSFIIK